MRITACLLWLTFGGSVAMAEPRFEAEALKAFETACLNDVDQFEKAMAFASANSFAVPAEDFRRTLAKKGDGAVWQVRLIPFLALHANLAAGCGMMLKPADEETFTTLYEAMPGLELISKDSFENSWSRWYLLERDDLKGILVAGLLDATDSKSAFLRYMPGDFVLADSSASDFLLTDGPTFKAVRKRLGKP